MVVWPNSIWLRGKPQDILAILNRLQREYHYVTDVLEAYPPDPGRSAH